MMYNVPTHHIRRLALQYRQEADTILRSIILELEGEVFRESCKDIRHADELFTLAPGLNNIGPTDNERHTMSTIVDARLLVPQRSRHSVAEPHELGRRLVTPIVRTEEHDRVLFDPVLFQCRQHLPDCVIGLCDEFRIGILDPAAPVPILPGNNRGMR